jgi:Cd2+/Zn2+-exporting ATPase
MQAQSLSHQANPATAPIAAELDELAALPTMVRLTVVCFIATAAGWVLGAQAGGPAILPWICYAVAFVSGGWYTVQAAWDSLKQREFDVNFLMIVAAIGAAAVGQPREGAILMFLFALSNTMETYAMGRTHEAVQALLHMAPEEATLIGVGPERRVHVETLKVGDLVRVRPGERIPIDGVVQVGASAVNEAAITGESMPAEKGPGGIVYAGTLNTTGSLDIVVKTPAGDTALAKIVQTVAAAREQKAQAQDFTDRVIGQYYAYAVVAMTVLAIAIPLLFLDWSLKTTLYRAMSLMVVASPCALVISIPAAVLSAMASAARRGVLFKGGVHLEAAARIKVVAIDKTGTLTSGQPQVTAVKALAEHSVDEVLGLAAAVEALSEHPLAIAVVRSAQARGLELAEATAFISYPGVGAQAEIGGRLVRVGRPSLFGAEAERQAEALQTEGYTVIAVGGEQAWGLIGLEDTVRPAAREALDRLRAAGVSRLVLLTGDNRFVADKLARHLGIDEVRAELMPVDKARIISELKRDVGPVAMVGDGINDAPALATADLGIAMGAAGSDVALQSADVLLMGDDLLKMADAIRLGRRTRRIIRQNMAFAFTVMAVLVISALGGNITLPLGVVGHEGSTLLVVANGLRLLRK